MGKSVGQGQRFPDEKALKGALELARRIGQEKVVDDIDILETYGGDESHLPSVTPAAVIRARSAGDVETTLAVASEMGIPVTPRGAGTGKSGGAIPVRGGLVLSLSGLDQIVDVDRENMVAQVQPGVVTARFQEAVEREGLFFPPDPASLETCCLGGNVAENAGGPRAFKYGVTGHYVLGATVVLPPGRSLHVGKRTIKGVAGYDITSLLVGSEGTLGVFTELTVRLVPRPQAVQTLLALFDDALSAGRAVSEMVGQGLTPRVLELLDEEALATIREGGKLPLPVEAGALLLVEVDGDEACLPRQVEEVADACTAAGALDILAPQTEGEARRLWAARRELSELLGRRRAYKLSDDVAVPRREIATMIAYTQEVSKRRGVVVACYGHAGDGNLHLNVLSDDPASGEAEGALRLLVEKAIQLGGTITGEHGVGSAKKHLLPLEQSPEVIALQRQLKGVFDPAGILNPGKIFL